MQEQRHDSVDTSQVKLIYTLVKVRRREAYGVVEAGRTCCGWFSLHFRRSAVLEHVFVPVGASLLRARIVARPADLEVRRAIAHLRAPPQPVDGLLDLGAAVQKYLYLLRPVSIGNLRMYSER